MDITTIEMPRHTARAAFEEYRKAVADPAHPEWQKEDIALSRAYKALAKGSKILDLLSVMKVAGLRPDGYPKFAIARADARVVWCHMKERGGVRFSVKHEWDARSYDTKINGVTFPAATFPEIERSWTSRTVQTMVPIIPPRLRPKHNLRGYHILWEVSEWKLCPPVDPVLLKHLGGWLYAVLAVWDLTPLERAVLGARAA